MQHGHVSVLHTEVLALLAPRPGETVLDCTLGLGGHATTFLNVTAPDGLLIGLDADSVNLTEARKRLQPYGSRLETHCMNFRDALTVLTHPVDIVFADLGLSSPHLDDPERGFTFRTNAPLDMRYDRSTGESAAELLLSSSVEQITKVLREFGEIQRSHQLAKELHLHFHSDTRSLSDWKTDDVVQCVEKVFTYRAPKVLPQVFQALRIAVNDELGAVTSLLDTLPRLLNPGGRVGIISYHSLEDRLVKHAFRTLSTPEIDERTGQVSTAASWELVTRKAVTPSAQELEGNPRSRSAKFRVLRRVPRA